MAITGAPASARTGDDVSTVRGARTTVQGADGSAHLGGELLPDPGGHHRADEGDDHQHEPEVLQRALPTVTARPHHPGQAERPLPDPFTSPEPEPPPALRPREQHDDSDRNRHPRNPLRPGPTTQLGERTEDEPRLHGEEPAPDADAAGTDVQGQHEGADAG
ncbi:hypothetical protein DBP15_13975 [Streptomyces sp. CS065A]|nr:hypothetical protein DBP15_13975 [Streptomyces sp. CS065A]